jgi:heterodisulfide reductase subunit A2
MVSVGRHPNIKLMTYSEVEKVAGYVGNFTVTVRRKPRYVNEDLCTGCGTCIEKCPWKKIPSEFDLGLGKRAAIYTPFPQAVPRVPVIDTENCAYFKSGKCRACEKFCTVGAIDLNQQEVHQEVEVGAIILATGFQDFDPRRAPQYGYRNLDNVVTSMELERMINTGGPTQGKVFLKDGRKPEKIAILHCIGSRGDQVCEGSPHAYCSRVCCMYSLKLADLAREYVGAQVVEFYRDMRAFGKDYESFYERVASHGVEFVRFDRDIRVEQRDSSLAVLATDVYSGELTETRVDMVVLSTGMQPLDTQGELAALFGVSRSPDGFFLEKHPKLAPVETATDGVYLAGTCQGPKDIPDSVAQGAAAAAVAMSLMDAGQVNLDPFTAHVNPDLCGGCRTCEGLCPYGAIGMVQDHGRLVALVNEVLCKGCGACAGACPAGAAVQYGFTNEQILSEIDGILNPGGLQQMATARLAWPEQERV